MGALQRKQLFAAISVIAFAGLTASGIAGAAIRGEPTPAPVARVQATPTAERTAEPTEAPVPAADPTVAPRPRVVAAPAPRPVAPPPPAAPAPAAPVKSTGGAGNNTALLIGIDNAPGSSKLEGSITDAKNMRRALLKYGFKDKNIKLLADATRHQIISELDAFARRTSGKGLAVFLLATHSGSSGGDLTFATGGGGRISRSELASRLGRVPGKMWSMFPTCYSGGYAVPGIVGKNRIAVFASSSSEYSYQLGSAGSWLVLYMVKKGMIERDAPSIENAYHWAKNEMKKKNPDRVPILNDGIAGDVKLAA